MRGGVSNGRFFPGISCRSDPTLFGVAELFFRIFPWELEAAISDFVAYYNNERYHESLGNVTPADAFFGRQYALLTERDNIKRLTMERRKREYQAEKPPRMKLKTVS
jgi:hypothetical protein